MATVTTAGFRDPENEQFITDRLRERSRWYVTSSHEFAASADDARGGNER